MAQMRDQDCLMDNQVIYLSIVRVGVSQSSTDSSISFTSKAFIIAEDFYGPVIIKED